MTLTADSITDNQIRALRAQLGSETYAGSSDDAADCEVAIAAPLGSLRRVKARARCAEILNERTRKLLTTIADDQIVAEYNGDLGVWSVGVTLPDGTYVGFGCATEAEVAQAKAQVRARCAELAAARSPA